jgi:hypothetical protein
MKHTSSAAIFLVCALLGAVASVRAQDQGQPSPALQQQPQAQPVPQQLWPADQLDSLVAPIALYPDPLLGQILVASTYPLEVVEASQWLQRNRNLRGQELIEAAKRQSWDPSVQALVAVPDALEKLNQDIRWTTDLGNAFLAQQADVMSAVQRMRARAQASGRLSSTPQQTVTTQEQGEQQVIVIEPANPQVIYVPVYDPYYVWGPPVWGYYPSLYYPAFGFGFGPGFNIGFCFGGWGGWGGWFGWGWGPNWFGHSVYVNNYFFDHYGFHHGYYGGGYHGRTAWMHDPGHRMHVPYQSSQVAARYRGGSMGFRDSVRSGEGPRGGTSTSYANGAERRYTGRTAEQGYRGTSPQVQRAQNPERPRYQSSQQYRSSPQQYGAESQTQRVQNQPQRNQSSQQYRSSPRQYGAESQTQRVQNQPQRYQSSQQYRTPGRTYGAEALTQGFQGQTQRYQASRQYQAPSQQYRAAPQAQQFQSQVQRTFQAPQQYRAAPQMSAPRFNSGGGFNRGGSGFSQGSGGINRGSAGFSQGSGGGSSRGGGGGVSRGGGGNHRR